MSSSARPRATAAHRLETYGSTGPLATWLESNIRAGAPGDLQPDANSSLADGVVVETRLVARLLGLRLLRVDGVVLLSPGRVREPEVAARAPDPPAPVVRQEDAGPRPGERLALAGRLIASTGSRLERTRAS